jgi:ribonuclease HI
LILYTDGGCNKDGTYGSWRIEDLDGKLWHLSERVPFNIDTNNQAEYTALIRGLQDCIKFEIRDVRVYSDSLLMVSQVNGDWKINNDYLRILREKVVELMKNFDNIILEHVPRDIIVSKLGH